MQLLFYNLRFNGKLIFYLILIHHNIMKIVIDLSARIICRDLFHVLNNLMMHNETCLKAYILVCKNVNILYCLEHILVGIKKKK
jgi:hypothetical protein